MPVVTSLQPQGVNQQQSVVFNASTSVKIGPLARGIFDLVSTANCNIAIGAIGDDATSSGYPILAGIPYRFGVAANEYIHALGDGVGGTLKIHPVNARA